MKRQMTLLATRLLLVAAMFGYCAQTQAQSEKKPYAWISDYNRTLTFYYDDEESMLSRYHSEEDQWAADLHGTDRHHPDTIAAIVGDLYEVPTNMYYAVWISNENITKAVFHTSFKDYTSIESTSYMFAGLRNLTSIEHIDYLNTSNVRDMTSMFHNCESLKTLDLTSFDMANVANTSFMFYNCPNLTTIYCEDTWTCENSNTMFDGCTSLVGAVAYSNDNANDVTFANPETGYFSAPPSAYAALSNDGTLTFYYDSRANQRKADGNTVFDMSNWYFDNPPYYLEGYGEKINTAIFDPSYAGFDGHTTTRHMFGFCRELKEIHGLEYLNTANVTDMSGMFFGCEKLSYVGDLSTFDTHNVTDMNTMFCNCAALENIDVSNFDTHNVINMQDMFNGCYNLKTLDVRNFDVQKVTNMQRMFLGCVFLTTIYCEDTWTCDKSELMFNRCLEIVGAVAYDSENANDVTFANPETGYFTSSTLAQPYGLVMNGSLFLYYDNLKEQRISEWNENFIGMDVDAIDFTGWDGTDISAWTGANGIYSIEIDASFANYNALKSANQMFLDMSSLRTISGLANLNTANVTDMSLMFFGCQNLSELDFTGFNTSSVTNMSCMFFNCEALQELDLTGFDVSGVTSMNSMFYGCNSLTTIYCEDTWTAETSDAMFNGCVNLKGAVAFAWENADDVTFANPETGYFTSKLPKPYALLSEDETTLTFYYDNQRNQREGTAYSLIYEGYQPEWAYNNAITTVTIDASLRDFDGLTNAQSMFTLYNLETLTGLENLNTENVTNMARMFGGCGLKEIDASTLNVESATDMSLMFGWCPNLTTIYCEDTWACGESSGMFTQSPNLVGAISWNSSKTDGSYANPITGYFTGWNTTGSVIDIMLVGNVGDARVGLDTYRANGNTVGGSGLDTGHYNKLKYSHNIKRHEDHAKLNVFPPTRGTWRVTCDGTDITDQFSPVEPGGYYSFTITPSNMRTSIYVVTVEAEAASNGDINGDGSITIADVNKLVNIVLGKE